jgi:hypothetical protein
MEADEHEEYHLTAKHLKLTTAERWRRAMRLGYERIRKEGLLGNPPGEG